MTKSDIIRRVAAQTGLSTRLAKLAVDRILYLIEDSLTRGEQVSFQGFGVFKSVQKRPGSGRNPRTGEPVPLVKGKTVRFKPSKGMLGPGGGRRAPSGKKPRR